jgi:anti-anti-sigma factor
MAISTLPPSANSRSGALFHGMLGEVHEEGELTVVTLRGEADVANRPALCDVLSRVIADGTGDVVIDLAESTFIDSAIVRTVATAQHLLDRQDRKLTLRSPSRLATRLLQLFVLTDLIEAEDPASRPGERARPTS